MEGVRRARQDRYIGRKLSPATEGTGGETHMDGYKLATYQASDGARAGLDIDDRVRDAAKLTHNAAYETARPILEVWSTARRALHNAAAAARKRHLAAPARGH